MHWLEYRDGLGTRHPISEAELALAKERLAPSAAGWVTNAKAPK